MYLELFEEDGDAGTHIAYKFPPRRVFYALPSVPSIWFSDYVFNFVGCEAETVRQLAKDVMDVDVDAANIFSDIETADSKFLTTWANFSMIFNNIYYCIAKIA